MSCKGIWSNSRPNRRVFLHCYISKANTKMQYPPNKIGNLLADLRRHVFTAEKLGECLENTCVDQWWWVRTNGDAMRELPRGVFDIYALALPRGHGFGSRPPVGGMAKR